MSLNKRLFAGGSPPPVEDAFEPTIYTGNGSSNRSITSMGFQPDLLWLKSRSASEQHYFYDSTRGSSKFLHTNLTNTQGTDSTARLKAFLSNGFKLGNDPAVNGNGENYVAYAWKCNGGTTSTNTEGSINSTVQVNNDTGLSIINYTGSGSGSTTVGHGLTGIPRFIIGKSTDWANNWITYLHDGSDYHAGYLDSDGGLTKNGNNTQVGTASTLPTSSLIATSHIGTHNTNYNFMLWAWEPKDGYSKFGTYTGTGSSRSVSVGFQPDFVIIKASGNSSDWYMIDSKRPNNKFSAANASAAEYTADDTHTFTSTGFTLSGGSYNNENYTWVYAAFREAT